jgi:hypothetical protein
MLWPCLRLAAAVIVCAAGPASSSFAQGPLRDWLADGAQRAANSDTYLQTDGPSFTRSSSTVPEAMALLESRYSYSASPKVNSVPLFDLRIGLTPRLEFRAQWAGVDYGANFRSSEPLGVGFKLATSKANGWIPEASLLVQLLTPTGYGQNAPSKVAPEVDYIYNWALPKQFNCTGSTGAIFGQPGAASVTEFYQSLELNRTLFDQHVLVFGEAYSLFGSGTSQGAVLPSMDAGFLLRPTHNLQFDWRAGFGLNQRAGGFFTGVGLCVQY